MQPPDAIDSEIGLLELAQAGQVFGIGTNKYCLDLGPFHGAEYLGKRHDTLPMQAFANNDNRSH